MINNSIKNKIISLLTNGLDKNDLLRDNFLPEELNEKFNLSISREGVEQHEIVSLIDEIVDKSVNTDHSFFMNQMYGKMNPISIYGDILTTLLNTSMYTYEVAPLLTLIEQECIANLTKHVWGEDSGDGVFTPGGSISNMKGLMLARNSKIENVKKEGINNAFNYSVFVSDQAHYSFLKAAIMMGFGSDSVVKVSTNNYGQIIIEDLLIYIKREQDKGRVPLMLVGVAGTTFSGVFDDLDALSIIAKQFDMWYHVDAVYGGSLMFSDNEKYKFKGIDEADSVSWNLHKVMGIPLICSALLVKEKGLLNDAFSVDADYLFHEGADLDLGQKSIQCGRRVDALKLWLAWKYDGDIGFKNRIDDLMNSVKFFAKNIKQRNNFELLCEPQSPIIIFRVLHIDLNEEGNNQLNKEVRNKIFKEGKMLFNYSEYKDSIYLRCVISDPDIQEEQIEAIIDRVDRAAKELMRESCLEIVDDE